MSDIKRILCPTDWSQPSRVALQAAVNMARHEGAELLLLHVLPPLGLVRGITSVIPLAQVIQDEARHKLDALIEECVPPDVRVKPLIRVGEEGDEIHLAALQADVVVMSTHGRSGWAHWAFGSVAETVLRESACPIFVVGPAGAAKAKSDAEQDGQGCCFDFPYKQVLWPTDWSKPAELALDEAIAIAAHHGAQLLLLHVIEAPDSEMGWLHEQHIERQFARLWSHRPQPQHARHLICHGEAAAEIARVALAEGADLIVMNSYSHTGWQRLNLVNLGSVAQKVLRQVPCPVFLVPHAALLLVAEPPAESALTT